MTDETKKPMNNWELYWNFFKLPWNNAVHNANRGLDIIEKVENVSSEDIQAFIESDPVYGRQMQLFNSAEKVNLCTALTGGVLGSGFIYKVNKALLPAIGAGLIGGLAVHCVSQNATSFYYGLYKYDPHDHVEKFVEYYKAKNKSS